MSPAPGEASASRSASPPFGKRLISEGLASGEEVGSALRIQAERAANGVQHNLGQILVEQGILTYQQVRDLLKKEHQTILSCPQCQERYNVPLDRRGSATCPADGARLTGKVEDSQIGVAATISSEAGEPAGPIGMEIGGCRIVELLGRGSMGAVYKAKHVGLNRYVAIKMIPASSEKDTIVRRLLFEARAIAKLEHPSIVQVYDVGCEKGYFFMVMQLLRGQTLEERLAELGMPDIKDSLSLVADVARGLEAAHGAGVIHRDLKPSNIIVSEDGRARLTDFGLARMGESSDELSDRVVGTPAYMAPEQWGRGPADGRSDLYSLGVILYLLVTGKKPFDGKSVQEIKDQHLSGRARAPRTLNPAVSEGLQAILGKMMARSPDRRYPTTTAFLEDLGRVLRDETPKALEETGRFVRCGFCETPNPAKATKCKLCGESLGPASGGSLEFALRSDERRCPACQEIVLQRARICSRCKRRLS
jgi:predicted Ser/Thr protein kinase